MAVSKFKVKGTQTRTAKYVAVEHVMPSYNADVILTSKKVEEF